jgi:hypothetical protein
MRNKTLIVCSVLVVSRRTTKKKTGYDVRNVSDWLTHCVLVWKKIFLNLVGDKYCLVLSLYFLYLFFFYFVTILCAFFVNYSPTQIRNTYAPNLGR